MTLNELIKALLKMQEDARGMDPRVLVGGYRKAIPDDGAADDYAEATMYTIQKTDVCGDRDDVYLIGVQA